MIEKNSKIFGAEMNNIPNYMKEQINQYIQMLRVMEKMITKEELKIKMKDILEIIKLIFIKSCIINYLFDKAKI